MPIFIYLYLKLKKNEKQKKNIALSEQFQNPKEKNVERVKIDTYNTQIQYTAHFPGKKGKR